MSLPGVVAPEKLSEEATGLSRKGLVAQLYGRMLDYAELTKPRVIVLVSVVTGIGYALGSGGVIQLPVLLGCIAGTALLGGGASALNQFIERRRDALMRRTESRPLPAGRLRPAEGLLVGAALGALGLIVLYSYCPWQTFLVGALSFFAYTLVYTPLKPRTRLSLHVGAVPGALPPVIGWSAASGSLGLEAWLLFAILFVWQIPHFASIGWLYREEYGAAGFPVISVDDRDGRATATQIVINSLLLILVSLLPAIFHVAGTTYFLGALILGLAFLYFGLRFAVSKSQCAARRVLHASLVYLPLVFLVLVLDRLALS